MTFFRVLWSSVMILVCIFSIQPLFAQELPVSGPLASQFLYLQSGTVQTRNLADLLEVEAPLFQDAKVKVLVLDQPMNQELKTVLENLGVKLLDYLPLNSFTVRLEGVSRLELRGVPAVVRVIEYLDSWRLQPGIVAKLGTHQQPARIELDDQGLLALIVSLHPGTDLGQAMAALREIEVSVPLVERVGRHDELSVVATPEQLNRIVELDEVLFIEDAPDITLRNSWVRWTVQTNLPDQTPVYSNGIHGEGQIIGVLDGRVDSNHCSFPPGKILFYNSTLGANNHGTHVAGTAAGNAGFDDDTRGVAYEAGLVVNTYPPFNEGAIISRLDLHHGQGARIHTNSWGDDSTTAYNSLSRGFDVFLRNNEESFVCLAVSNQSTLRNPDNAKNLLAVGATSAANNQHLHCYGGVGPTSDGRRKPEVYAPGCDTWSAAAGTPCLTFPNSGTSMACPAVAGASALIRQYYMEGFYPSGSANAEDALVPTGALIKATVVNSAVDLTGETGYPTFLEGWGRIRINDPLHFVGDVRALLVLDDVRNTAGLDTDQMTTYTFNVVSSAEELRITTVWTDVAATAGTSFAAVNNLDLEVTSPGGTLFRGNVFSNGFSSSGDSADIRNNVEQVHIDNPDTGTWTVCIRGTAVNSESQGYSVVATGDVDLVPPPPLFKRGDCNADGLFDIGDAIYMLSHLFSGGALNCADAGDSNDDGLVDIGDPITILGVLFSGGDPLADPGSEDCGPDATKDSLGCDSNQACP